MILLDSSSFAGREKEATRKEADGHAYHWHMKTVS